ncbi:hypothetical protein BJ138DRAFT_1020075, partial [Hygrophoropsis aurantiaca]
IVYLLGWHMNNGLQASNSKGFMKFVKGEIHKRFRILDMGPISKFIGIQFERDRVTRQILLYAHVQTSHYLCSNSHKPTQIQPQVTMQLVKEF